MNTQALKNRWQELTSHFLPPEKLAEIWQKLEDQYAQPPGRAYHNLGHISDCFSQLDQVLDLANNRLPLELAIFFHDVVYDPQSKVPFENEEKSAQLAVELLTGAGFPPSECSIVANLILDTRHAEVAKSADGRLLVDIDLSILGRGSERFWAYEKQIREEYGWVEESAYRAGRANIMQGFLDRERLYQTAWFFDRYEEQARKNLTALIKSMQ